MSYMITRFIIIWIFYIFVAKGMKRKQEKRYKFADSHGGCYSIDGRHTECLHMSEHAYKSLILSAYEPHTSVSKLPRWSQCAAGLQRVPFTWQPPCNSHFAARMHSLLPPYIPIVGDLPVPIRATKFSTENRRVKRYIRTYVHRYVHVQIEIYSVRKKKKKKSERRI